MPRKKMPGQKTLTVAEKLVNAKALVAKYEAQLAQDAITAAISVGDRVDFKYGRGPKVRTLSGKITGIKDTPTGKMVAILSDDGFDAYRVRITDIVATQAGDPLGAA